MSSDRASVSGGLLSLSRLGHLPRKALPPPSDCGYVKERSVLPHGLEAPPGQGPLDPVSVIPTVCHMLPEQRLRAGVRSGQSKGGGTAPHPQGQQLRLGSPLLHKATS